MTLKAGASPQETKIQEAKNRVVPGNIKLLPGHEHVPRKGIDSRRDQFVKRVG